jgi:integrase
MPVPLIAPLRQHLEDQDAEREATGVAWQDLPRTPGCTTPGTLRALLLSEQHVDMHVIQRILGHAQVSITRPHLYRPDRPADPLTREAADRIGRALWPDVG